MKRRPRSYTLPNGITFEGKPWRVELEVELCRAHTTCSGFKTLPLTWSRAVRMCQSFLDHGHRVTAREILRPPRRQGLVDLEQLDLFK